MKKLRAAGALLAAAAAAGLIASTLAPAQPRADVLQVRVGDRIRVAGAPIGCRVLRMSQLGGRVVIDCRRAGALRGTYGTLFSAREAVLVEFESPNTARRVAVGAHGKDVQCCGQAKP
jgi:hypothetical protein